MQDETLQDGALCQGPSSQVSCTQNQSMGLSGQAPSTGLLEKHLEKHYESQVWEPLVLQAWEAQVLEASVCKEAGPSRKNQAHGQEDPPIVIMMPPPNVTGSLHLGHAMSSTLQDVLVRFFRMKGREVVWVPGTDHAGIATQMMVERHLQDQHATTRHELGREAFVQQIWVWKEKYGDIILKQMKRLGFWANWERTCFTLDAGLHQAVIQAFVQLHQKGLIYRAQRLVNWDTQLQTAVSDLEVVSKPQAGHMWTLSYPLASDPSQTVCVATTRPETLFGDVAIAVHPDDPRYHHLHGQHVRIPLTNRTVPIVPDDQVTMDKGTGAVKITPGHDFFDFDLAKRHDLPLLSILDGCGRLIEPADQAFVGMDVLTARKAVLKALAEHVIEAQPVSHTVPYSDRSGTAIQPRLTWQWFVETQSMAQKALQAVQQGHTSFLPASWVNSYTDWMKNIQPWCVSRQLWWGHRLPVWYGPDGAAFVACDEAQAHSQSQAHYGQCVQLHQDEDVLDTWFSSGLWPFATFGWPQETPDFKRYYPTTVLVTGFDILFFWVARMMMLGIELTGQAPFAQVLLHPLIQDERGQKMSKTKKNVIDPLAVIEDFGADALRFALVTAPAGKQYLRFGPKKVEDGKHFVTKLWNLARFLQIKGLLGVENSVADDLESLECCFVQRPAYIWLIDQTNKAIERISQALATHQIREAGLMVHDFIWHTLCDFGVEMVKYDLAGTLAKETKAEPQSSGQNPSQSVSEAGQVMRWAFGVALRLLNPFMPFVSEVLWAQLSSQPLGRLRLAVWPVPVCLQALTKGKEDSSMVLQEKLEAVTTLRAFITLVRRLRNDFSLPSGTTLVVHVTDVAPLQVDILREYQTLVKDWLALSDVSFWARQQTHPVLKGSPFPFAGGCARVDLEGVIDMASERVRLSGLMAKWDEEIAGLEGRLHAPQVVAKTPEDVVQEWRDRLEERSLQRANLAMTLASLSLS
jgi:valyl-tRNA synthetase